MPTIHVENRGFTAEINSSDLNVSQQNRFSICQIVFPTYLGEQTILDEGIDGGRLGELRLTQREEMAMFVTDGLDSAEKRYEISNSFTVRDIDVDQDESTFEPCVLDNDKNGIVSERDIEIIYQDIPFFNPKYDINNDGIVNQDDLILAREYVGTACPSDPPPPPPPPADTPSLDLDCFTWEDGDNKWYNSSPGESDSFSTNGLNEFQPAPLKNSDGSLRLGAIDENAFNTIGNSPPVFYSVPPNNQGDPYVISSQKPWLLDVDSDFSIDLVFKFPTGVKCGNDVAAGEQAHGNTSPTPNIFQAWFGGIPLRQSDPERGGFMLILGHPSSSQYATDPDVFVPYRGIGIRVSGGEEGWNNASNFATGFQELFVSDYDFGLHPSTGIPVDERKFIVQITQKSGNSGMRRIYINGELLAEESQRSMGIALPERSIAFYLPFCASFTGLLREDQIDLYSFRIYNEYQNQIQVEESYQFLSNKYGV